MSYNCPIPDVRVLCGHCVGLIVPLLPLSISSKTTPAPHSTLEEEAGGAERDNDHALLVRLINGAPFAQLAAQVRACVRACVRARVRV